MAKPQKPAEFVVTQTLNVASADKPEPSKIVIKPGKTIMQYGSRLRSWHLK